MNTDKINNNINELNLKRIHAEINKINAETLKIEEEHREIRKKNRQPWYYNRKIFLQSFFAALISIPLIWFYVSQLALPILKIENIKSELANAKKEKELNHKLADIEDSYNLLTFQKKELEDNINNFKILHINLNDEYELLKNEYELLKAARQNDGLKLKNKISELNTKKKELETSYISKINEIEKLKNNKKQNSHNYALQFGVFSSLQNAKKEKTFFENKGFFVYIRKININDRTYHGVTVGSFITQSEASLIGDLIKEKYSLPSYQVIKLNSD